MSSLDADLATLEHRALMAKLDAALGRATTAEAEVARLKRQRDDLYRINQKQINLVHAAEREVARLRSGGEHDPTVGGLLHRAETEPIGIDISDYSDEWCEGFLAGQRSVLEEIFAGRLVLPGRGVPS